MPRYVTVKNRITQHVLLARAKWGDSFWARFQGLMFRARLAPNEALILVEPTESRMATSIHMFFVPFAIATVWINKAGRVVDKVEALPWRPYYAPRAAAQYTLETHPAFLREVEIGDELVFEPCPE